MDTLTAQNDGEQKQGDSCTANGGGEQQIASETDTGESYLQKDDGSGGELSIRMPPKVKTSKVGNSGAASAAPAVSNSGHPSGIPTSGPLKHEGGAKRDSLYKVFDSVPFTPSQGVRTPSPGTLQAMGYHMYSPFAPHGYPESPNTVLRPNVPTDSSTSSDSSNPIISPMHTAHPGQVPMPYSPFMVYHPAGYVPEPNSPHPPPSPLMGSPVSTPTAMMFPQTPFAGAHHSQFSPYNGGPGFPSGAHPHNPFSPDPLSPQHSGHYGYFHPIFSNFPPFHPSMLSQPSGSLSRMNSANYHLPQLYSTNSMTGPSRRGSVAGREHSAHGTQPHLFPATSMGVSGSPRKSRVVLSPPQPSNLGSTPENQTQAKAGSASGSAGAGGAAAARAAGAASASDLGDHSQGHASDATASHSQHPHHFAGFSSKRPPPLQVQNSGSLGYSWAAIAPLGANSAAAAAAAMAGYQMLAGMNGARGGRIPPPPPPQHHAYAQASYLPTGHMHKPHHRDDAAGAAAAAAAAMMASAAAAASAQFDYADVSTAAAYVHLAEMANAWAGKMAPLHPAYLMMPPPPPPPPPPPAISSARNVQQEQLRGSAPRAFKSRRNAQELKIGPDGMPRLNARQRRTLRRAKERALKGLIEAGHLLLQKHGHLGHLAGRVGDGGESSGEGSDDEGTGSARDSPSVDAPIHNRHNHLSDDRTELYMSAALSVASGSEGPKAAAEATQVLNKVAAELEDMDICDLIAQLSIKKEDGIVDDKLIRDLQIIQNLIGALKAPVPGPAGPSSAVKAGGSGSRSHASGTHTPVPAAQQQAAQVQINTVAAAAAAIGLLPPELQDLGRQMKAIMDGAGKSSSGSPGSTRNLSPGRGSSGGGAGPTSSSATSASALAATSVALLPVAVTPVATRMPNAASQQQSSPDQAAAVRAATVVH